MIETGTCSWTEKTLLQSGEFYPKHIKTARDRLMYYADHFSTVEVDSSYYAMPGENITSLWAERTPDHFTFHIKAYGALTGHGVAPGSLPKDILSRIPDEEKNRRFIYIRDPGVLELIAKRFAAVLDPLKKAGKLGLLVFQYPQWFHYRSSNLDYILTCKNLMEGLPVAVEFRHGSWLVQEQSGAVFDFLEKHKITYITADEPQYGSLATVPFFPRSTTDTAYFRFHGRNTRNWLKKGIETSLRYAYYYSDDELREFAKSLKTTSRKTKKTYAMFNNCHGGFAVRNALKMRDLIKTVSS